MKKYFLIVLALMSSISLLADWVAGEIITTDYSWTDSNGEQHSIHELTASGKAVFIYWGGYS